MSAKDISTIPGRATHTISYGASGGSLASNKRAISRSQRWYWWRRTADRWTDFPTTQAIRLWAVGEGYVHIRRYGKVTQRPSCNTRCMSAVRWRRAERGNMLISGSEASPSSAPATGENISTARQETVYTGTPALTGLIGSLSFSHTR